MAAGEISAWKAHRNAGAGYDYSNEGLGKQKWGLAYVLNVDAINGLWTAWRLHFQEKYQEKQMTLQPSISWALTRVTRTEGCGAFWKTKK